MAKKNDFQKAKAQKKATKMPWNQKIELLEKQAKDFEKTLFYKVAVTESVEPNVEDLTVKITLEPSIMRHTFSRLFEHQTPLQVFIDAGMKFEQDTYGKILTSKEQLEAQYEVLRSRFVNRCIEVFHQNRGELAATAIWNIHSRVRALATIELQEEDRKTFNKPDIGNSRAEWVESLTYGYYVRLKKFLGVEKGRPPIYKTKAEFLTALDKASKLLLENNKEISQDNIAPLLGAGHDRQVREWLKEFNIDWQSYKLKWQKK